MTIGTEVPLLLASRPALVWCPALWLAWPDVASCVAVCVARLGILFAKKKKKNRTGRSN
jgi:hypothetical protein